MPSDDQPGHGIIFEWLSESWRCRQSRSRPRYHSGHDATDFLEIRTLLLDSARVLRIKLQPPLVIRLGGAPVGYSDSRFEDGTAIPWARFSAAVDGVRMFCRRCSCRALHRAG